MNTISLLPAVSAYCEERIKELDRADIWTAWARVDELRRIVTLCEGLEKTQNTLAKMLDEKQQFTIHAIYHRNDCEH